MKLYEHSPPLTITNEINNQPIYLVYQYFVPNSIIRGTEYKYCLTKNVQNKDIEHIYLLNEKIYNEHELGVKSDKITQININRRISYNDIFDFVETQKLTGYIVFINADIYLESSIKLLKNTNIHTDKALIALLRYDIINATTFKIFGPRSDSQDTWIFHSNFNPSKNIRKIFNFNFGKPGCDNKIAYLFRILGYKVINCPDKIKSIHVHTTQERNYTSNDKINPPYYSIEPSGFNSISSNLQFFSTMNKITNNYTKYTFFDNDKLRNYIENNNHFIIPRIAGIENQFAHMGHLLSNPEHKNILQIYNFIKNRSSVMKNNAGIYFKSFSDVQKYSQLYLSAFENCNLYSVWEPFGDVYRYISESHDFITNSYPKQQIWAFTFDIFHYIHINPWTIGLKGKKILIISSFINSIKEKISVRENIYGIDLFPNCEFVFLKPPQTNGSNNSRVFTEELNDFIKEINSVRDKFDVALVSCGGYGNLVCNAIYEMGKSAIYVGGVLQMYFGIYGERWMRERKDILNIYMNKYWSRPTAEEKPINYKSIEGSCYW
jgi:hypothetical protein